MREQQKEDAKRLQRLKEWMKENALGLISVTITVAGIITTIIVSARKAIISGAQATFKFGKAVANLGKNLGVRKRNVNWVELCQMLSRAHACGTENSRLIE